MEPSRSARRATVLRLARALSGRRRNPGLSASAAFVPAGSACPTTRRASGKASRPSARANRRRRERSRPASPDRRGSGRGRTRRPRSRARARRGCRARVLARRPPRRARPRCGARDRARPIDRWTSGSAGSMWVSTSTSSPISSAIASSSSRGEPMGVAERHRAVDFEIEGDGLAALRCPGW